VKVYFDIHHDVDLAPYNSFGVHASAAHFCEVTNLDELKDALAFGAASNIPVLVLGGGSNILLSTDYLGLVIRINFKGIERLNTKGLVKVAAGENWHEFVESCMNHGFHGLENLALIPGTVGAAPIQNIGAYGVEFEQFVVSVSVYDKKLGKVLELNHRDCKFGYRDSLFKNADAQHLIVLGLTLQLAIRHSPNISYGALLAEFAGRDLAEITNRNVFDAVCRVRSSKLPDPKKLGNAGSFFKNPLVSAAKAETLKQEFPDIPCFDVCEMGLVKIPAAWLLDQAGWRGKRKGGAGVHEQHALVIVNAQDATGEDIVLLAQEMAGSVLKRFGIALESEVRLV
jgi:UDP-N-acetylmuramate dehydrogenase